MTRVHHTRGKTGSTVWVTGSQFRLCLSKIEFYVFYKTASGARETAVAHTACHLGKFDFPKRLSGRHYGLFGDGSGPRRF